MNHIGVSEGKGCDDYVPLLTLETLYSVHSAADGNRVNSAVSEYLLKPTNYQSLLRPVGCDHANCTLPEFGRSIS
jgi:hypothetical protein